MANVNDAVRGGWKCGDDFGVRGGGKAKIMVMVCKNDDEMEELEENKHYLVNYVEER